MSREKNIDIIKGILILLVVIGHSCDGIVHDIIFLFHMPLFFIISGLFIRKESLDRQYLKKRLSKMLVPYFTYGIFDCLMCRSNMKYVLKLIWGGRYMPGTYWYVTCFLFTLFLFYLLTRHFSDKTCKCLIIAGGGISIIESCILTGQLGKKIGAVSPLFSTIIKMLNSPGIPWNLDVSLLALLYLSIGYCFEGRIKSFANDKNKYFDIIACVLLLLFVMFCFANYRMYDSLYYFDMKQVYYHELLLAILIPCSFGIVLARLVRGLNVLKHLKQIQNMLAFLGRITLPIMFMHVPLNSWRESIGYGSAMYVLIGIGVPVLFTVVFQHFSAMRVLFGLPRFSQTKRQ